jgi:HlyD family secretion protein
LVVLAGCQWSEEEADAYGQFRATEVQVAAEHRGQIRQLNIEEGKRIAQGDTIGWIDTTELATRRKEVKAKLETAHSRLPSIEAKRRVLQSELEIARKDLSRLEALKKEDAATQKQIDDARGRVEVLKRKMESVKVKRRSARAEEQALKAQLQRVEAQLDNALILNPVDGTVLTKYKEKGEVVQYGQPLYKVANLDTMDLRVYVSGEQLPEIELGQTVRVFIDKGSEDYHEYKGTVQWLASEAEFTPQMIQTKEERVSQVYAMDVRVVNDGKLKIGMPGEVSFDF